MYKRPTPEAHTLKHELEKHGLRVLVEVDDGHKHVDLAIPAARINIEVDGKQHYEDPFQIMSDLKRAHYSDDMGYDTIHVPNVLIKTDVTRIAGALAEAAKMRASQLEAKFRHNKNT
jgi:very-short-patch-repair endonuclease